MRDTFNKLPEKKQAQILDAAAHVFARKGYDAANVSAICKKARISNGALYKYFKNKEDLFAVTLSRVAVLFQSIAGRHGTIRKSVYDVLRDILKDVIDLTSKNQDYIALYLELGSPSMKHFSQLLSHPLEEPTRDFWVYLVEEGKKRGEIDKKLSSRMAAYSIDNHVMTFMFSLVSPHYLRRFECYLSTELKDPSKEEKARLTIRSLKRLLT
jgi:TetR/AcrR family transcriptional regulator